MPSSSLRSRSASSRPAYGSTLVKIASLSFRFFF
jgi:hypothetical protein